MAHGYRQIAYITNSHVGWDICTGSKLHSPHDIRIAHCISCALSTWTTCTTCALDICNALTTWTNIRRFQDQELSTSILPMRQFW